MTRIRKQFNFNEDIFKLFIASHVPRFSFFLSNSIKFLPAMAFENLNSLETLSIQNNKLTTMSEEVMEPIIDTLRVVDIMGELHAQNILWCQIL